jgi:hypothetical protein
VCVSCGGQVDDSILACKLTFCLVYDPAPGHSVMMSSFASLFVANANATPEKVVPWELGQRGERHGLPICGAQLAYKINANNQLRLAPAVALDLGSRSCVCSGWEVLARRRAVASGAASVAWRASGDWRAALHWW